MPFRPSILVAGVLLAFSVATPAHAYLDPGTGSLIVQSIVGGIVGAFAVIAIYWRKLLNFFTGRSKNSDDQDLSGKNR